MSEESNKPVSEQVKRIVADRIARKQWRSETLKELRHYVKDKSARAVAEAYVITEYEKAGGGTSGRFQG